MRKTLRKHSDFLIDTGFKDIKTDIFILKTRPCIFEKDPRYGIVATKKTFKLAVDRNKARRRLKASLIIFDKKLSEKLDYIFILKRKFLDTDFKEILDIVEASINN